MPCAKTLSSTVQATTGTIVCAAAWSQFLDRQQAEDDGRQPAWAEPAHEQDGFPVQAASGQGQGDWHHAYHRQAQCRVEHRLPGEVVNGGRYQYGAEEQPHQDGGQRSGLLDEQQHALWSAVRRSEGQAEQQKRQRIRCHRSRWLRCSPGGPRPGCPLRRRPRWPSPCAGRNAAALRPSVRAPCRRPDRWRVPRGHFRWHGCPTRFRQRRLRPGRPRQRGWRYRRSDRSRH